MSGGILGTVTIGARGLAHGELAARIAQAVDGLHEAFPCARIKLRRKRGGGVLIVQAMNTLPPMRPTLRMRLVDGAARHREQFPTAPLVGRSADAPSSACPDVRGVLRLPSPVRLPGDAHGIEP